MRIRLLSYTFVLAILATTAACSGGGEEAPPPAAASPAGETSRKYLLEQIDDAAVIQLYADQFAALLFGLNEDANHYAYRYNTKDGDTALWRVVDGQRERLHHGGVPVAVKLGEWRTLRLRIAGAQVTGFVDDTQALTFTLPAPVTGKVGLWSKADSVTDYRNFTAK